jgi:hypothetical protein
VLNKAVTNTLVIVRAVRAGAGPTGVVDVQPLVHQIDGKGGTTPHGIVHNLPYMRLQGGTSAVIIDPSVGDIGLACIPTNDISKVKTTRQPSPPGSLRRNDHSDGLYIGGFLNATPTQYIKFDSSGITIHTPGNILLEAGGDVTIKGAHVNVNPP